MPIVLSINLPMLRVKLNILIFPALNFLHIVFKPSVPPLLYVKMKNNVLVIFKEPMADVKHLYKSLKKFKKQVNKEFYKNMSFS